MRSSFLLFALSENIPYCSIFHGVRIHRDFGKSRNMNIHILLENRIIYFKLKKLNFLIDHPSKNFRVDCIHTTRTYAWFLLRAEAAINCIGWFPLIKSINPFIGYRYNQAVSTAIIFLPIEGAAANAALTACWARSIQELCSPMSFLMSHALAALACHSFIHSALLV